jgi:sulfate/thiosulfate transport system permease protein
MLGKYALRLIGLGYLGVLLAAPVGLVFYRTFENGFAPAWDAVTTPDALHALKLTLMVTAIAVPANTVFGIVTALLLVRTEFRGKALLNALLDVPFAVSPVVIGLALILVYGANERVGGWLEAHGIQVIFAWPGIVLATIFVSLPFVVREVVPVLREIGTEQEQAATTLGASPWSTFWRITLPSIRVGVIYGVVLATARALGEFGAVSVVSGRIAGQTDTMTLHVENQFQSFDVRGAYAAAVVLALIAIATLVLTSLTKPKEHAR